MDDIDYYESVPPVGVKLRRHLAESADYVPIHRATLGRLQRIEALARAVVEDEYSPMDGDRYCCTFCFGELDFNSDKIEHADDCPWAQLRAALGEDGRNEPLEKPKDN
jgi:hypothetical protein